MEKIIREPATADNTAYTLRANALALRDIAPPRSTTSHTPETLGETAAERRKLL